MNSMSQFLFSKKCIVLGLLMGTCLLGLSAQDGTTGNRADTAVLRLSLSQAKEYAVKHNRNLRNATLEVRKAQADRWASLSSLLPQVNAGGGYSNYFGYKMDLGTFSIAMPPYATFGLTSSVALSASQIIAEQLAKLTLNMANTTLLQTEQQICDNVKLLYYSALVADQTITLLERNLESMHRLYEFTRKAVDVGVSEPVEADQIQVQVATVATALNSAERSREMVFNSLHLALDIDVDTEIELTQGIDDLLNVQTALALLTDDFILNNNYSYRLLLQHTELVKKQLQLATWAYAPSISIAHQYNARKYFSDQITMNMTPPNMLTVQLNIPIFSSGSRAATVRSRRIAYEQQLNTLANTEQSLKVQHRQLRYNLNSAYERFETQKQNVAVTQRVFDNIGKKYEYGMASSLDLTNAGTNLITAQSHYVEALLAFVQAQIELETLLNK